MATTYRFLRRGEEYEVEYQDLRDAFDHACHDIDRETAAPLEIRENGRLRFSMSDLCDLCDVWTAWRAGTAEHPLGGNAK